MATANGKDVIYVDVDDEITGIIDKVNSSDQRIVALVLPKRATVFQSIVNMKLLKRRADTAKKHLVLITSEAGLMPLAASVGVHVAKTLQSKPEIPEATMPTDLPDDINEDEAVALPAEDFDADKAGDKPVGELAGSRQSSVASAPSQMNEEAIELDNSDTPEMTPDAAKAAGGSAAAIAASGAAGKAGKNAKKDKKLKVPNFHKFRLRLVLAGLAIILLIVAWFVAFNILPAATVAITSDSSNVNTEMDLTLDTGANSLDESQKTVPAQTQQVQKNYTQQAPATGQQNKGNTATGTVTLTAQKCGGNPFQPPSDVPAGTGVSANGITFITQENTSFSGSGASGGCYSYSASPTDIKAQAAGAQYNVGDGTSFSVAGRSDVSGSGSTSGGTDNIQKVVQQSDIDGAKQKLTASADTNSIKKQLQQSLESNGLYAIQATFNSGKPSITPSANAGDAADNVTVTENVTYTMFGVKKADLTKLLDDTVNQQIDPSKQSILDDGLGAASFSIQNNGSATQIQVSMQATSTIGPKLDQDALKKQLAGKKTGDVKSAIKAIPGVKDVSVKYSPFWVSSMPKKTSKITFVFEKSSDANSQ